MKDGEVRASIGVRAVHASSHPQPRPSFPRTPDAPRFWGTPFFIDCQKSRRDRNGHARLARHDGPLPDLNHHRHEAAGKDATGYSDVEPGDPARTGIGNQVRLLTADTDVYLTLAGEDPGPV